MPRWSRQEQHGVRKDSLNLPRFYSRIQVQFSFFPRFAFCSFTLWILHQLLFFAESSACFLQRYFASFAAFKMGVKTFWTVTILCIHRDAFFLLRHDIFDFTEMPSFCCATIFMVSPRCLLFVAPRYLWFHRDAFFLLRHNIYGFTESPSFDAPRYFCFHRVAHLLMHHDIYDFTTISCRKFF